MVENSDINTDMVEDEASVKGPLGFKGKGAVGGGRKLQHVRTNSNPSSVQHAPDTLTDFAVASPRGKFPRKERSRHIRPKDGKCPEPSKASECVFGVGVMRAPFWADADRCVFRSLPLGRQAVESPS